MKNMVSKFIGLVLICSLISSSACFASTENLNVSTTPPGSETSSEYSINSISLPENYVDLNDYGRMDFGGSASGYTLYLNNGFTGVTGVFISVHNKNNEPLTVYVYKNGFFDTKVDTQVISAGSYYSYSVNLSRSSEYYLAFKAPSEFEGYLS